MGGKKRTAGKGNNLFRQYKFIVAKQQKYQSRSFKSFHRPPLYRPSIARIDITRTKYKIYVFSCFDAPRFKSTVQCGILRGNLYVNLYDVDCRCSRCSRPLFPLSTDFFFRSFDSAHPSLLTCTLLSV